MVLVQVNCVTVWRLLGWLTVVPRPTDHTAAIGNVRAIHGEIHTYTHTHKWKGRPPSLLVGLRPTMRTPQQNPLVFHLWSNRINYTNNRSRFPLLSTLRGLPRVEHGVVNLYWEQWRLHYGVFSGDMNTDVSLPMLPSCDCIWTSTGCKQGELKEKPFIIYLTQHCIVISS